MSVAVQSESARTGGHPLDNPVWSALTGPHARFAQRVGEVIRYAPEVSVFLGVGPDAEDERWAQVAELVGPGGIFSITEPTLTPPPGFTVLREFPGVQLVDEGMRAEPDPEAVVLGPADVPEMLDLVERTEPGPFRPRTIEMGTYLGIRRGGALVAMAGERMRPPGWTEISAVCTDPGQRGQGLATRLMRAVAAGIRERGETPFLHAAATNTNAIRLYEALGFRLRRRLSFRPVKAPE
jgi:ribosomal protein S18 acetylase RimI-like enzyme